MKRILIPLLLVAFLFGNEAHAQLPIWPHATRFLQSGTGTNTTGLTPHQFIDWTTASPASVSIPNVGLNPAESNMFGQAQAGINACNEFVFFAIHNGEFPQVDAALEIYTPAGVYLPLPGGDMNANAGDDEVQIIRRPGFANQWFVVYSLAPAAWPNGNPGYQGSLLAYSLIEVNSTAAYYVNDGGGSPIQDIVLEVGGVPFRYFHGKATSRTSNSGLPGAEHDIYAQRRDHAEGTVITDATFQVDRFVVDGTDAIVYDVSSAVTNSYAWSLMVSGSPIELSPDELTLAVMARTQNNDEQEIYLFDPVSFGGSSATTVNISELWLEFTTSVTTTTSTGLFHQPIEFDISTGTGVDWLRNFERKISGLEFSPSGDYLYICSGGYVNGFNTNLTYLVQIDLTTTMGPNSDFVARFHVQTPDPLFTINATTGAGPTWTGADLTNYWNYHGLTYLQSSLDGNMYFTKSNSAELFVYPSPDVQMITDVNPQEIDYGTALNPNIAMDGFVLYMPDQIDGYDYSQDGYESVSFNISNQSLCNCDTLEIDVVNSATGDTVSTLLITECPQTITLCLEEGQTFDLLGSNGVDFEDVIILGSVVYPVGTNMFNFGNGGAINTTFTTVTTPLITSDEVWDAHYFIPDNMIVVVDGATLDLTNVDIVFGECAGIDFINGAMLRANNSVLRPCQFDGTWRGLNFYGTSQGADPTGIVNECTFKNAQRAIYAYNQKDIDVRVTNNLFSNCKAGVVLTSARVVRSISGNTFLIDDLAPKFDQLSCSWGNPGEHFGVLSQSVTFTESIAQNDFVAPDFTIVDFVGIADGNGIDLKAINNNFTNTYQAVQMQGSRNSRVESNEINVSNEFNNYEHQIAAFNCQTVLIGNNEIASSSQYYLTAWAGNNSAIYINRGSSFDIKENFIDGFETGIQLEDVSNIHVTDNELHNCYFYGAYLRGLTDVKMSCNAINMEVQNDVDAIGIGYYTYFPSPYSNEISSNCVFESTSAMHFEDIGGTSATLPVIRNNYMFNYKSYGIESVNMTGNIGSSPSPALGAGRNSFITNNGLGVVGDIVSTNPLTSFGNYGLSFVSGTVSISGNNVNSTASCGNQIDLANSSNGYMEICDDLSHGVLDLVGKNGILQPNYENAVSEASYAQLLNVMLRVQSPNDMTQLDQFYTAIEANAALSQNELLWLRYYYASMKDQQTEAINALMAIQAVDQDESDAVTIEHALLLATDQLDAPSIGALETIAAGNGRYAHVAQNILHQFGAADSPAYYATREANHAFGSAIIAVAATTFNVYPNPTKSTVSFEYSLDEDEIADLVVVDVSGKIVSVTHLSYQHSTQVIDVSMLPEGIYTLSIQSSTGIIAHSKLVKL